MEKGYERVYAFTGGIPEWQKYNYPMDVNKEWRKIKVKKLRPDKLEQLLQTQNNLYILDVRPLNFKRNKSFIVNSFFCPLVYLIERYHEIPKDREIIITDWAMKQSPTAAKFLETKGYKIVGVLKGGIERWQVEGKVTEERVIPKTVPPLQ